MSSKVPTVRQSNWLSLFPHLLVLGSFILLAHLISPKFAFLIGPGAYLLLSFSLRRFVPTHHRIGIAKNNAGDFKGAIEDFKKSYSYFTNNLWIDKYRFVTMLSSSNLSYREMALVNIAFCHGQIGEGAQSKKAYERALSEFPNSIMAKSALAMISSFENSPPQDEPMI